MGAGSAFVEAMSAIRSPEKARPFAALVQPRRGGFFPLPYIIAKIKILATDYVVVRHASGPAHVISTDESRSLKFKQFLKSSRFVRPPNLES